MKHAHDFFLETSSLENKSHERLSDHELETLSICLY